MRQWWSKSSTDVFVVFAVAKSSVRTFFFQRCERNYLLSLTGWFLSELCSYQSHRKLVWLESEALLSVSTAEKKVNKTREREKYFFRRKSLSVTSLLFPVEIGWKLVLKYSLIAVQWQYSRRMFSMDGINVWLILLLMISGGTGECLFDVILKSFAW